MTTISICIPSYNRKEYLKPLLDSIRTQSVSPLEVLICEDCSPQRADIEKIVIEYKKEYPNIPITLHLNDRNLGYDCNFKQLLSLSKGEYCLFMGNDDLLCVNAISNVFYAIENNRNIAVISRAYSWFVEDPSNIVDTVSHLSEDKFFESGLDAVKFFFRRVGVLSGLVFDRKKAIEIATEKYDGFLYYQMYLAGNLLKSSNGYYISTVQTLSRDGIEPDFGNATVEKKNFKPGGYGYESRLHMVKGMLTIAADLDDDAKNPVFYSAIRNDIGNYFYPYVRDQLKLPFCVYLKMIREFSVAGMGYHFLFLFHSVIGFMLKQRVYDNLIKFIRKVLGHSPRIGI